MGLGLTLKYGSRVFIGNDIQIVLNKGKGRKVLVVVIAPKGDHISYEMPEDKRSRIKSEGIMAREFKETAHLSTNKKLYDKNFEKIFGKKEVESSKKDLDLTKCEIKVIDKKSKIEKENSILKNYIAENVIQGKCICDYEYMCHDCKIKKDLGIDMYKEITE